jgi:predicted kinase
MSLDEPIIIAMLGSIGAGKSYFTRQLAAKTKTLRLNADSLRLAWYGSLETIKAENGHGSENNKRLFRVVDVLIREIIGVDQSVILDMAQFNKRDRRQELYEIADTLGAKVILVWIQTPRALVVERVGKRDERQDQRQIEPVEANVILDDHDKGFAEPTDKEYVIKIDGTQAFEKQYEYFTTQLNAL